MANKCTPLHRPGTIGRAGRDLYCLSTAAVTGRTFVDISATRDATTGLIKVATATPAGRSFGVARDDAAAGIGVAVVRDPGAIVPVTAGGSIAAGGEVEVGTGGRAVTQAAGIARGRAVEDGTAGAAVHVELY